MYRVTFDFLLSLPPFEFSFRLAGGATQPPMLFLVAALLLLGVVLGTVAHAPFGYSPPSPPS